MYIEHAYIPRVGREVDGYVLIMRGDLTGKK